MATHGENAKTREEARVIARSSDPEWLGDELFRLQQLLIAARNKVDDLAGWCRYALDNWAPGGSGKAEKMEESLVGTIGARP